MFFNDAISCISGFRYITDSLNIRSSAGRRYLLSLPFLTEKATLETVFAESDALCATLEDENSRQTLSLLEMKLSQLRDIKTTLNHLQNRNVLDDVELFEIKHFAILSDSVRELILPLELNQFHIPELSEVISILDPENKRIPHFHIYNRYSSELAALRQKIDASTDAEKERLIVEAEKMEDEIRRQLSQKIHPHAQNLMHALNELARLDVEIAKAEQRTTLSLCKPSFSSDKTTLQGMFHPQVAIALEAQGKRFQRIDIVILPAPTVITGANMAGKSVLLKTVALIQTLAQFGFYVPAASAEIAPVDNIFLSAGDEQDEMNGLSSFASEMLRLNDMVQSVKKGTKTLALIDELARTTNPAEGKAIVCGMLDFLAENNVRSLITTHYSIDMQCRRIRVKGFIEPAHNEKINIKNINNYMDYSLEETTEHKAPHEALRIAEIIGVNDDVLERTKKYLKK